MPIENPFFLNLQDIVDIHSEVTGINCTKTKFLNKSSLLSVLGQVPQVLYGEPCYPSLWDKAAVYMCMITWNHPFQDGNKRTAFLSGIIFLKKNHIEIELKKSEGEALMWKIAINQLQITDVARFLQAHENTEKYHHTFRP
jgi:death-on-curing protein